LYIEKHIATKLLFLSLLNVDGFSQFFPCAPTKQTYVL